MFIVILNFISCFGIKLLSSLDIIFLLSEREFDLL